MATTLSSALRLRRLLLCFPRNASTAQAVDARASSSGGPPSEPPTSAPSSAPVAASTSGGHLSPILPIVEFFLDRVSLRWVSERGTNPCGCLFQGKIEEPGRSCCSSSLGPQPSALEPGKSFEGRKRSVSLISGSSDFP